MTTTTLKAKSLDEELDAEDVLHPFAEQHHFLPELFVCIVRWVALQCFLSPSRFGPGAFGNGPDCPVGRSKTGPYGKGSDTGPPQAGAASLSFCVFSRCLAIFLGFPAGFPYLQSFRQF